MTEGRMCGTPTTYNVLMISEASFVVSWIKLHGNHCKFVSDKNFSRKPRKFPEIARYLFCWIFTLCSSVIVASIYMRTKALAHEIGYHDRPG